MLVKHTKRYVLRFHIWWIEYLDKECSRTKHHLHVSNEEFDTKAEMNEVVRLYEELYKDTPRPEKIKTHYVHKPTGKILNQTYLPWNLERRDYYEVNEHFDFSDGNARFWGYVLLDFEEEKILGVYHDKRDLWINWKTDLSLLDKLFRKPGEIPENYKWDEGEYQGWLQYRWGNGLNAIEVEDKRNEQKNKKPSKSTTLPTKLEVTEEIDDLENKFSKQIEKEEKLRKLDRW